MSSSNGPSNGQTAKLDPAAFPGALRAVAAKVEAGERLDEADALTCLTTPHILHLGRLADTVRSQMAKELGEELVAS